MIGFVFIIAGIILFIIILIIGFISETKEFNNGKCIYCGNTLIPVMCIGESRKYGCTSCGYDCLVSFDSIDKEFRQK